MYDMDKESLIPMTNGYDKFNFNNNYSFIIKTIPEVVRKETDPEYEQFLADVWVGIVLTLMVLSCVCCMCSCLLYHKFQQWKRSVIEARAAASNLEAGNSDTESLPSYTIVSGLPSYDEALEQLSKIKQQSAVPVPHESTGASPTMQQLSVKDLFQIMKPSSMEPAMAKG